MGQRHGLRRGRRRLPRSNAYIAVASSTNSEPPSVNWDTLAEGPQGSTGPAGPEGPGDRILAKAIDQQITTAGFVNVMGLAFGVTADLTYQYEFWIVY